MTAADRARTAAKLAAQDDALAPAAPTSRTKPIRSTLDLPPARHHALRQREAELMQEHDAVRGLRQHLLSAMVAVYLTDATTARRVDAQLAEDLRRK